MAPSSRDSYRDKMSQMIAEYLLKGYTMLNAYCPECNSPLMRFRQEPTVCVICRDITKKGNAVTVGEHSPSVKVETGSITTTTTTTNNNSNKRPAANGGSKDPQAEDIHNKRNARQLSSVVPSELPAVLQGVISACSDKLVWATDMLRNTTDDYAEIARLNELIQQTITTIEKASQFSHNV